ncbi:hypothetical protein [Phenylobacterium sp.]|uniref:hypothetical protein n=1 Tax=Phenylobacterium sp. TaxID=1871053 RepID=UPI0025CCD592|nr:hypothetical protein [Phenylobacterium sp.]
MSPRLALLALAAAVLAGPAHGQPLRLTPKDAGPPRGTSPLAAEIWPFPAPDPGSWWDDKRPQPSEAADPLGGRRVRKGERLVEPDNGVDAATYRLWGLMPLQWQLLRGEEMVLEVWVRPANSVRQSVARVIVRGSGDAFVQGRAGLACCEAGIGRRVGFDARLPAGTAARFLALRSLPLWGAPRDVRVEEAGAADTLCLQGTAYDLTLATPGRAVTLRRACDPAEVGEAAEVLEAVLGAALGHDPRFDVIVPGGAGFGSARKAYRELIAGGGRLKPNPEARRAPPGSEPKPEPEDASPTPPAAGSPAPGPPAPGPPVPHDAGGSRSGGPSDR